jgi:hypothetical protein
VKKLALLAFLAAFTVDAQRIVYTKVFPKSVPEYVKITITQAGAATYQEEANELDPTAFQVDSSSTAEIFDLAAKLNHFKGKLESNLKVAKTGDKTYRWEDGTTSFETTYNYSTNENAKALQDWFERITETQRILADLQRSYKYDRLGVNEILVRLDAAWRQKRVVGPEQFIAILDRIQKNEALLNIARDRAGSLSDAFKAVSPPAP